MGPIVVSAPAPEISAFVVPPLTNVKPLVVPLGTEKSNPLIGSSSLRITGNVVLLAIEDPGGWGVKIKAPYVA
jgi:hypothetical protein